VNKRAFLRPFFNRCYGGAQIVTPFVDSGVNINITALQNLGVVAPVVMHMHINQPGTYAAPAAPAAAVYVPKEGVSYAQPGGTAPPFPGGGIGVHSIPTVAVAVPQPQRNQMRVTIPPGCFAGSTILVNTPAGTQVQVHNSTFTS